MSRLDEIDVSQLDRVDRLGLAYCRLSEWEWDEILGRPPDGFEDMPRYNPKRDALSKLLRGKKRYKHDYVWPAIKAIRSIIGEANMSRCWWRFMLGRTEDEWLKWYISERFKDEGL